MASRPVHRLLLAMVVVAAGNGLVAAHAAGARGDEAGPEGTHPGAVSVAPTAVEMAVVPARVEPGPSADAARHGPGRGSVPPLAALVGLGALARTPAGSRSQGVGDGSRPLRSRRHCIVLRAPPSLRLA